MACNSQAAGVHCAARRTRLHAEEVSYNAACTWSATVAYTSVVGNYDLNVIQIILHSCGFESSWLRPVGSHDALFLTPPVSCVGILLNRPESACCGLWKSNHWYSLTLWQESWYLMDSRAAAAQPLSTSSASLHLSQLLDGGGHALLVNHTPKQKAQGVERAETT
jgi:hypothetical protein